MNGAPFGREEVNLMIIIGIVAAVTGGIAGGLIWWLAS